MAGGNRRPLPQFRGDDARNPERLLRKLNDLTSELERQNRVRDDENRTPVAIRPDKLSGLTAVPLFGGVELAWDPMPANVAQAIVYAGVDQQFAEARAVATTDVSDYRHYFGDDGSRFYWIVAVGNDHARLHSEPLGPVRGDAIVQANHIGSKLLKRIDLDYLADPLAERIEKIEVIDLIEQVDLIERVDLVDGPPDLEGSVASRLANEADDRAEAIANQALKDQSARSDLYEDSKNYTDHESAVAHDLQQFEAAFGGNAAGALDFTVTEVDARLSVSTRFQQLETETIDLQEAVAGRATVQELGEAVSDAEHARAQLQTTIQSLFESKLANRATVQQLTDAITNAEEARAQLKTTIQSEFDDNLQNLATVQELADSITTAQEARAELETTIQSQFNAKLANRATVQDLSEAVTNAQEARANLETTIQSQFDAKLANRATVQEVSDAITSAEQARAQLQTTIQSQFDQKLENRATVQELSDAITSAEQARAQLQTTIQSQFSNELENRATVEELGDAMTDAQNARAELQTTLQSGFSDQLASVRQTLETDIDETRGSIEALYTLQVQIDSAGRYVAGGLAIGSDGQFVDLLFDIDRMAIGRPGMDGFYPFTFSNGAFRIKEAMIEVLTFDKLIDANGNFAVRNGRLKVDYIETENLRVRQSLIVGAGALASTDTADWLTQVTGQGRPADYADVTSENTAADFKGRGALATTDTADWKTQITGQGRPNDVQYEARALPSDGWYRIAVNGGNRAKARFILWDTENSRHNQAEFTLSCSYNRQNRASFALLDSSRYGSTNCIDQIRLLTGGTYDTMYVDVHIIGANDSYTLRAQILDNVQSLGWTIGDLSAASVPDGYNVTTWDINYDRVADNTGHNTAADFKGRGALARQNSADWESQIQGRGKPSNNADVTRFNTSGDTATVNGRDAQTVRLRADDVQNWRKSNGQIRTDKVEYSSGDSAESLKPGEAGANVTENRTSNDVKTGSGRAVEESGANKTEGRTANDVRVGGGRAVAQSGADKTASKTSADTVRVDGEGSSSVRRKANDGRKADTRTAPWENTEGDMDEGRISAEEGAITTIKRPRGGAYKTGNDATGAIRIRLPRPFNGSMIQFHVEVFQYKSESSFTLMVSGYIPSAGWRRTTAQLTGSTESNNGVRFATGDDNHPVVYIGDTDSFWDHAQIVVKDFQASFNNQRAGLWSSGWSVDLVTSFSGVQTTISDALIDAKAIRNQGKFALLDFLTKNNIAAYLESAAIERAYLGKASVGTLEIEGEAVTVTEAFSSDIERDIPEEEWTYVMGYNDRAESGRTMFILFGVFEINATAGAEMQVRLLRSGQVVETVPLYKLDPDRGQLGGPYSVPIIDEDRVPGTYYSYRFEVWMNCQGGDRRRKHFHQTMKIAGLKR